MMYTLHFVDVEFYVSLSAVDCLKMSFKYSVSLLALKLLVLGHETGMFILPL